VALYILKHKRGFIADMEARYGVSIAVQASERMQGANFAIERSSAPTQAPKRIERAAINMESGFDEDDEEDDAPLQPAHVADVDEVAEAPRDEAGGRSSRRRRRRRGGRRDEGRDDAPRAESDETAAGVETISDDELEDIEVINAEGHEASTHDDAASDDEPRTDRPGRREPQESRELGGERRSRRRGRRGGRGRRDRQHSEGGQVLAEDHAAYPSEASETEHEHVDFGTGPQPIIADAFPVEGSDHRRPPRQAARDTGEDVNQLGESVPGEEAAPTHVAAQDDAPAAQTEMSESSRHAEPTEHEPAAEHIEPAAAEEPAVAAKPWTSGEGSAEEATRNGKTGNGVGSHEEAVAVIVEEEVRVIEPASVEAEPKKRAAPEAHHEVKPDEPSAGISITRPEPEDVRSDEPPRPARKGWWQRRLGGS
jgi:ribonuclease E